MLITTWLPVGPELGVSVVVMPHLPPAQPCASTGSGINALNAARKSAKTPIRYKHIFIQGIYSPLTIFCQALRYENDIMLLIKLEHMFYYLRHHV
jgi:hypothetical protein